jgi:hypothetical protein
MAETYPGSERRKSQRFKINIAVTFEVNKPLRVRVWIGDEEVEANILDLSESGLAILTRYNIPVATRLTIGFMLYRTEKIYNFKLYKTIEVKGEVRSNILLNGNEHRLGIYFTQIDDEDKYEIANFVKMGISCKEKEGLS